MLQVSMIQIQELHVIVADRRAGLDSVIEAFVDAIVGAHVYQRARTGRVASGSETRLFDLFWPAERRPR
jgi:hypothetical protein